MQKLPSPATGGASDRQTPSWPYFGCFFDPLIFFKHFSLFIFISTTMFNRVLYSLVILPHVFSGIVSYVFI